MRRLLGVLFTLMLVTILVFGAVVVGVMSMYPEPALAQTTWTVDDDSGADFSSIQAAINAAFPGDIIEVAAGTYMENITWDNKPLTIIGSGSTTCIIDGSNKYANVIATSGLDDTARLDGFTITGAKYGTGGMFNASSSPTVTNCTFYCNEGFEGGGMTNSNASPTVTNCTFYENQAVFGGGMSNFNGSPTVTNCTFYSNRAFEGGGMLNSNASPTVTNCTFYSNEASEGGGMSNCWYASPTVTNCTFYCNEGLRGGGMKNWNALPTVTNCTFYDNQAAYGGGISNWDASPTVTNCILYNDNSESEIYSSGSCTPTVTYCDIEGGYPGEGNVNTDPLFVDPGNGNFHLKSESPCIDAGNNDALCLPETDFENDPRIMGCRVDMGVDETPNRPPVAVDDSATTNEGNKVKIDVLDNDSDPDECDTLIVGCVSNGANGSVVNNNENVTYTPNPSFYGNDSFSYKASDGKAESNEATVTVVVNRLVIIDIKPGSYPNSINLGAKGVVSVAVLTTVDFDAGIIDPGTVEFAGAAPKRWTLEDVDGDGDLDLLFHFRTQELKVTEGSEDATLTGQIYDGYGITGTDSIKIVR